MGEHLSAPACRGRCLILTAGMGDGHTPVARELARRLAPRGCAPIVHDVLDLLPPGVGAALRIQYRLMLRWSPESYETVYQRFQRPVLAARTVAPVTALLRRAIERAVAAHRPRVVVSTFHLAGLAAGALRGDGRLAVPSVVVVNEFALHEVWLAPHTDLFCCPSVALAREARGRTGRPAVAPGPVVAPRFRPAPSDPELRRNLGADGDRRPILIGAGAWGTGTVRAAARVLAATGRYAPVVLCGRNDGLRRDLEDEGIGVALGWQPDLAPLLNAADALIDNAGGATCCEAFAVRTPVVAYRPLAGHGRAGTISLAHHGLLRFAAGSGELLTHLDALTAPGPARDAQASRAAGLFAGDAVEDLLAWTDTFHRAGTRNVARRVSPRTRRAGARIGPR